MLLQIQWDCYEIMFISCLSPCGRCKARRVMVLQTENIWARSRVFRRLRHQMARRDIRINSKGCILVFVNPFWHLPCRCHEKGFISCLSPCGWCETRRVMVEQAENIWACSRIFRRLRHQWLAETFASTARGLYWFLSILSGTYHADAMRRGLSCFLWVRTATKNASGGFRFLFLLI